MEKEVDAREIRERVSLIEAEDFDAMKRKVTGDESPEEPTQEAPQQTTEEDAESDTSDEGKPVESEDEPKEEVEKSVPMLKDPGQMFKACYEYQESRKLNGLYSDEISKVCGGVDPQAVIGYHSGSGAVQRIRCSDGYIYRFNGQNMRRL